VSRRLSSPTARTAIEEFLLAHGGRLVEHDLDGRTPSALLESYELLLGEPRAPALVLDHADLLVSFGCDLFGTGPDPVAHTASWSASRRRGQARHVQIEGSLSLTGAAADERILAAAIERREMALALLREVAETSTHPDAAAVLDALRDAPRPGADTPQLGSLASELLASAGRSLVVSGANDLGEQLAVALVNRLLGSEGTTLDLAAAARSGGGLDRDLDAFRQELLGGGLGALVVLDIDLVSLLPVGEEIEAAIGELPLSIAVSERPNATTSACHAVAAAHHGLECWSDVESHASLVTLAQPAVRPLFATRHPIENFLYWSGAADADYRRYLQAAFRDRGSWTSLVRSAGLDADLVTPAAPEPLPLDTALGALSREARVRAAAPEIEVELRSAHAIRNQADAANPWLRELPDPLTRVSWVPAIRVAPELARARGIEDGDVLEVATDSGVVTMPARVLPGQHPRVIGVPLGYVEQGQENASRLARFDDGRLLFEGLGARIEPTGRRDALPLVQIESSAAGRPVVHQLVGRGAALHVPHHPEATLWPEREKRSPHWEMVIDLDTCTGCSACVVACQAENNIPVVGADEVSRQREMHWLRIDRYFVDSPETTDVLFEPMLCAQCDNAPCETVCPVAATVHSEDGLNQQIYNRCVGTRYCANNCPYKVRRFNWFDNKPADPIERLVLSPDVVVRPRGVMEKCSFCVQRIQGARIAARREGLENFSIETACQQSCPAQAIRFGDGADPESDVRQLGQDPRAFQVLAELGVRPSISYLARMRHRTSESSEGESDGG
jgi:molybdopterin-containing oxidoreductase family iron-sulfur binding subunit